MSDPDPTRPPASPRRPPIAEGTPPVRRRGAPLGRAGRALAAWSGRAWLVTLLARAPARGLAAAVALGAGAARAQPAPSVLILAEAADEAVARRLEAELEMLGLRATLERPDDRDGESVHRSLPALARERRAMAALRLVPSEGRVQLWLSDRVTGKTTLREVSMPSGPDAAELLALRAVELLRASLLELRIVVRPGGEIPPPSAAERLAGPGEGWTPGLWLGPAVAWSPGGTGASVHPLIGLRWLLGGRVGPEVLALLPMGTTRVSSSEGSAAVSRLVVSAGLRMEIPLTPRLGLGLGAGGGLASLTTEGSAQDGYLGTTSTTRSASVHVALGASLEATRHLRLGLQTLAAASASRHVISFADRPVATWGRPLLVGALVAELRLP